MHIYAVVEEEEEEEDNGPDWDDGGGGGGGGNVKRYRPSNPTTCNKGKRKKNAIGEKKCFSREKNGGLGTRPSSIARCVSAMTDGGSDRRPSRATDFFCCRRCFFLRKDTDGDMVWVFFIIFSFSPSICQICNEGICGEGAGGSH